MSRLTDLMDNYLGIYLPEQEYFEFPFLKEQHSCSDDWKKFDPWPREGRPKYKKQPKPVETRWSKLQKEPAEPAKKIKTYSMYEVIKAEREEKKRQESEVKAMKIDWKKLPYQKHPFELPNQLTGLSKVRKGNRTIMANI